MIKSIKRLLLVVTVLTAICFCLTLNVSKTAYAENNAITIGGESFTITEDDYFVRSTAIRLDDSDQQNGVRFKTVIKKTLYQSIESAKYLSDEVEYGLLLIPAYRVAEGEELTVSTQYVTNKTVDDVFKNVTYTVNGQDVEYKEGVIYVYDIPRSHLTDDIMVRSYLKVNGSVVYYSQTKQISMAEVAYKEVEALNDGTSPLPSESKDKDYYVDYITENYLTYYAKCYYDGEVIGQATIKYNESIVVPDFTKRGHTLQGVYTDSGKTKEFDSSGVDLKGGDFNIYADFSKNSYKLKINYLPAANDGLDTLVQVENDVLVEKTVNSVERNIPYGDEYSVTSPALEGYTVSNSTVSGNMSDSDKEVTVYYTRQSYTFTVTHENEKGVFETQTQTLKYGESLSGKYAPITSSSVVSVSATQVGAYVTPSNNAVAYTYALKTDASSQLSEGGSTGALKMFNGNDDVSIKYTHTGSGSDWAKLLKVGDTVIFNGCIIVYNTMNAQSFTVSNEKWKLFDGAHGSGNTNGRNYNAVIPYDKTYTCEVVFRGSNGTIEWYRGGIRVLQFLSTTSCLAANGNGAVKVSSIVSHIIDQINNHGVEVLDAVQTGGTDDGTVSAVSFRLAPASVNAAINYTMSGDGAYPNNVSYVVLSGDDVLVDVAMPGYTYTVANGTVTSDKLSIGGGGTFNVSYVRNSTTAVFSKTGIDRHIVRIGQNLSATSYVYGMDLIEGNFYLEIHLQDIFMMMTDHSSNGASVTRRTPIVQITDGNDFARWRRFFLNNHTEYNGSHPFGEVVASNNWWGSGNFVDLWQKRLSCYIKVIRQNSLIQVTYYITLEGAGPNGENLDYSFNYRMENVTSSSVNVSLDAYDSAFKIDWIALEASSYYTSTNSVNDKSSTGGSGAGYYNYVYAQNGDTSSNYEWNNVTGNNHKNVYSVHAGVYDGEYKEAETGTGNFDWSFSYYTWGCYGKNQSASWNEAKSTSSILFMVQADTTAVNGVAGTQSVCDYTNPYKTYCKLYVTCFYDADPNNKYIAAGSNWFVPDTELGIVTDVWKNATTNATFDDKVYSPFEIYYRAYVYYRIVRKGGTVTVTQRYVPLALSHNSDNSTNFNNDQTRFIRTVTFTNVYQGRGGSTPANLKICIGALNGGIEVSGAYGELQEQSTTSGS